MNGILDQLFGGSDYSEPSTYYLGLCTSVGANGTITGEPSGNNYARVSISNTKSNWTDAASGMVSNKVNFDFPTASGSWGTVSKFFLSSSSTGGTALCYGPLDREKSPVNGDQPRFMAGDLDITLTDLNL